MIAAIYALLKTIPGAIAVFDKLLGMFERIAKEYREQAAHERKVDKDNAVAAGVADAVRGLPGADNKTGQQPSLDGGTGIQGSGNRSTGLGD